LHAGLKGILLQGALKVLEQWNGGQIFILNTSHSHSEVRFEERVRVLVRMPGRKQFALIYHQKDLDLKHSSDYRDGEERCGTMYYTKVDSITPVS
jgi:hypothetical protein